MYVVSEVQGCSLQKVSLLNIYQNSEVSGEFSPNKAAVSWKFGHCSARASLEISIITHEH